MAEELIDGCIKQRTFIAASPERVFDTITSAAAWDSFFTTGMRLEPEPEGVCEFAWENWGPDGYTLRVPGQVVEVVRPERFVFRWGSAGNETTVRFALEAVPEGTVVTITETGYRDNAQGRGMMLECASGWGEAATLLKFYVERGVTYGRRKGASADSNGSVPVAINFQEKLGRFADQWSPKVIAQMNDHQFKLSRLEGEFIWHAHEDTDEAFVVLSGELRLEFRSGSLMLRAGEMCVVPRGVEHKPSADAECCVLVIERAGTANTGDAGGDRTAPVDRWI